MSQPGRPVLASQYASVAPDRVWRVLADPYSYASWVPGTARIDRLVARVQRRRMARSLARLVELAER
jgi:uncharacterized protein YndB with AHSA1/START domain